MASCPWKNGCYLAGVPSLDTFSCKSVHRERAGGGGCQCILALPQASWVTLGWLRTLSDYQCLHIKSNKCSSPWYSCKHHKFNLVSWVCCCCCCFGFSFWIIGFCLFVCCFWPKKSLYYVTANSFPTLSHQTHVWWPISVHDEKKETSGLLILTPFSPRTVGTSEKLIGLPFKDILLF